MSRSRWEARGEQQEQQQRETWRCWACDMRCDSNGCHCPSDCAELCHAKALKLLGREEGSR